MVGQWTKRLIPDTEKWIECKYRQMDYYLTQVLTGHGRFQNYAHKMGKAPNSKCRYCPEEDSAEHTIFYCIRWKDPRTEMNNKLGLLLTPENLIPTMLGSISAWKEVKALSETILRTKEKEDRA